MKLGKIFIYIKILSYWNNYQPNSVSVFEFDLEEEEFWVYVERQIS